MRRLLFMLCLGTALCLTGCSQPIEKAPVIIKDEKTPQVTPIPAKASEKPTEDTISIKEHLQDVTTLDNAISPFYISDAQGAVEWRLQKCDGGFGFYYPVYGDDDIRAWNMPKSTNAEEYFIFNLNYFTNNSGVQLEILCIENQSLKDVNSDFFKTQEAIQMSNYTIGIHDYPAIKAEPPLSTTDIAFGRTLSEDPLYSQYYFVDGPEGLLCIRISSPIEETEDFQTEIDIMLSTFIIESKDDYTRKNSAVPIRAEGKKLRFKTLDVLSIFYSTCINRGDYNSSIAVSKNISNNLKASEVWKSMKCYTAGNKDRIIKNNRAVEPIHLTLEEPGNTGLPASGKEGSSLIRYIYFVKKGDYWYVDGPLHNTEPPEEWCQGKDFTWSSENYGLSDSPDIGETITTQEEMDAFQKRWSEKCR